MADLVRVCSVNELQPGDKRAIQAKGESVLVANVNGNIYAVSNICTHEYAELVNGFLLEDVIACPLHLSRFRLETGEVVNPPATKPLKTYKVVLEKNDIFVEVQNGRAVENGALSVREKEYPRPQGAAYFGEEMGLVTEALKPRMDYRKVAPDVLHAMLALEECVRKSGLERRLLHLVKLRASQINGCAWCIDMHTKDARADGETEQRLYLISAWREAPFFSERERAALAWTEAVTLVSQDHVPDEVYDYVREHFTEKELAYLTLAIVAINGWNRFNVSMRTIAGDYHPQHEQGIKSHSLPRHVNTKGNSRQHVVPD